MIIKLNGITFSTLTKPAVTKEVNDLAELADRSSDRSATFLIPATLENAEKLELANLVNTESVLPYNFFIAEAPEAGIDIGLAKLQRSTEAGYEFNLFGGLINFFKDIETKSINDLDLSEYDHIYDIAEVQTAINNTSGYVYPLMNLGTFPDATNDIPFDNFKPAVYFYTILLAIFKEAGYTFKGSIFNTEEFKSLILPFCKDEFSNGKRYAEEFGINLFQSTGTISVPLTSIPASGVNTQYYELFPFSLFTATSTIEVTVSASITISNWNLTVPAVGAALQLFKNGVPDPAALSLITADGTYNITLTTVLAAGDTLQSGIVYGLPAGTTLAFDYSFDYTQGSIVTDYLESKIRYGGEVQLDGILPDINQKDFVKAICVMYGLTMQANNVEKYIEFKTFNEIFFNVDAAVDWSNKIDTTSIRVSELSYKYGDYAQINNLKYAEDEAVLGNYDGIIEVNDNTLEPEATLFELIYAGSDESQRFIGTLQTTLADVIRIEANEPAVGEQEYIKVTDRVLKVISITTPTFNVALGNYDVGVVVNFAGGDYLKALFNSSPYPLNFDALKDRYFNKLEESTLNRVKVITVNAHLLEADVSNLDFFKPIFIDGLGYFYLNTVSEFTGSDTLTECTLVKL